VVPWFFKLTIASFVWDNVVKTGRRFQNFIKEIYAQCFSSRLKRGNCWRVATSLDIMYWCTSDYRTL